VPVVLLRECPVTAHLSRTTMSAFENRSRLAKRFDTRAERASMPALYGRAPPRADHGASTERQILYTRKDSSVDADRCAQGFADRPVQDEVGDRVEAGRLAVDDNQGGAVAIGELRKAGRRIDDE